MRKFEKISLKQFVKDTGLTEKEYNEVTLPHRATSNSAGYDFHILKDTVLKPGEIKKIPTAIKTQMNKDEVLMVYIRSSLGQLSCTVIKFGSISAGVPPEGNGLTGV